LELKGNYFTKGDGLEKGQTLDSTNWKFGIPEENVRDERTSPMMPPYRV
jgi:hypothetical protein